MSQLNYIDRDMRKLKCSIDKCVFAIILLNCTMMIYIVTISQENQMTTYSQIKIKTFDYIGMKRNATRTAGTFSEAFASNEKLDIVDGYESLKEDWQPFDSTTNSHYVYSAYLHNIRSHLTIKVIGVMCKHNLKSSINCKLRYRDSDGNVSMVSIKGSARTLTEGSHHKFKTSMFFCKLPDQRIPFAVSLTTHDNDKPQNILPVRSHVVKPEDRKRFAICVSPLFGNYDSSNELIQWIELNRILGAEYFVFYNHSIGKNVNTVLRFYEKKGLAQIVQWGLSKFRLGPTPELVYIGQHFAMNDCLMKVKNLSEFVVNTDVDEVIVPHEKNVKNWNDIIQKLPKKSGYYFRSCFFRMNFNNTNRQFSRKEKAEELNIVALLKLTRESSIFPPGNRAKYFVKTDAAEALLVHSVFEFVPGNRADQISPEVAFIHHYRIVYAKIDGKGVPDPINNVAKTMDDTVLENYGDILIDNVIKIHEELYTTN